MSKVNILLIFTGIVFYNIIPTHAVNSDRLNSQYKTEYEALSELVQYNVDLFDGVSIRLEGVSQLKNRCNSFVDSVDKIQPKPEQPSEDEISKCKEDIKSNLPKFNTHEELLSKLKALEPKLNEHKNFLSTLQSKMDGKEVDVSEDYKKHEGEIYRKLIDGLNVTRDLAEIEHNDIFLHYHDIAKNLEKGINKLGLQPDGDVSAGTNLDNKYNELVSKFKADSLYISTWIKVVEFYQSMLRKSVEKTDFVNDNLNKLPGAQDLSADFKNAKDYILHANTRLNSNLAKAAGDLATVKYSNGFFAGGETIVTNVDNAKYTALKEAFAKYTREFEEALAGIDSRGLQTYANIALTNVIKLLGLRYVIYSNINERFEKGDDESDHEGAEGKAEEKDKKDGKDDKKAKWTFYGILIGIGSGASIFIICSAYIIYCIRKRRGLVTNEADNMV